MGGGLSRGGGACPRAASATRAQPTRRSTTRRRRHRADIDARAERVRAVGTCVRAVGTCVRGEQASTRRIEQNRVNADGENDWLVATGTTTLPKEQLQNLIFQEMLQFHPEAINLRWGAAIDDANLPRTGR